MLTSPRHDPAPPPAMAPLDPSILPMPFDAAAAAAAPPVDSPAAAAIKEHPCKQQRPREEEHGHAEVRWAGDGAAPGV